MNLCDSLVSIRQLASTSTTPGIVPLCKSAIYDRVAKGEFPQPFKLGPRKSMWDRREIEAWILSMRDKAEGVHQ